ncbi:LuxR C-terminal-related transcriptional regulator [Allorhizocola rhizosphaerae]|uniref:LuxR C-terminal-related transcriptional regulator n=1 Tax=Allorhizocola rhizosphaerae TaxID=1872709 RepID=UPI000E3CD7D8
MPFYNSTEGDRLGAVPQLLSQTTVEFHLGRVYRKLGVGSRAEPARLMATLTS